MLTRRIFITCSVLVVALSLQIPSIRANPSFVVDAKFIGTWVVTDVANNEQFVLTWWGGRYTTEKARCLANRCLKSGPIGAIKVRGDKGAIVFMTRVGEILMTGKLTSESTMDGVFYDGSKFKATKSKAGAKAEIWQLLGASETLHYKTCDGWFDLRKFVNCELTNGLGKYKKTHMEWSLPSTFLSEASCLNGKDLWGKEVCAE